MIQGNIGATKILCKEIIKDEKTTKSGLIIPNISKDPQTIATVIQVGSGTTAFPMETKVGERVIFYPIAAQRFNIEDEQVLLLDNRDILFKFIPDL
jgi:co-chaperonin GroES (HSP10)